MIAVEVDGRRAAEVARRVLAAEGVEEGELGIAFVTAAEIRALKREHLGLDEATDALAFPIDGRTERQHGNGDGEMDAHVPLRADNVDDPFDRVVEALEDRGPGAAHACTRSRASISAPWS